MTPLSIPTSRLSSSPKTTTQPSGTPSSCPVTNPNGGQYYSNGSLRTILQLYGKAEVTPDHVLPDGSLAMKFPWWREDGVVGKLEIQGRRLDAPAPPLRADIPDGYGDTGFQASAIIFPTEGCWEVVGKVGDSSLTFVTLVYKIGESK
jgi:hypothetical protein